MKAAPLALACALLGATTLVPAAFAQTSSSSTSQTPAEASPSTSSPDMSNRTITQAQREWRDQDGRVGGSWGGGRDGDDERFGRDSDRGDRRSSSNDDDDDEDMMRPGRDSRMGGYAGRGMPMSSEMMRWHMRMMEGHHGMAGHGHGARFKLKRGDSSIDIRCPSDENISTCVDAVGKLMDRLQAMPQTSGTTTSPTPTTPSTTAPTPNR